MVQIAKVARLLCGKTVPTTVKHTSTMSDLGAASSVLSTLAGLMQSNGNNPSALSNLESLIGQGAGAVKRYFGNSGSGTGRTPTPSSSGGGSSPTYDPSASGNPYCLTYNPGGGTSDPSGQTGLTPDSSGQTGLTPDSSGQTGLTPDTSASGDPYCLTYNPSSSGGDNSSPYARGGLVYMAAGCASTVHRGALPSRR
jgi:hypothetical protein